MKSSLHKIIAVAVFFLPVLLHAQGDLKVTVLDENNQPMFGSVVSVVSGGAKTGGQTDAEGNFTFRALAPGTYDIQARMINYKIYVKKGIVVNSGQTSYTTFPMQLKEVNTDSVVTIRAVAGPFDPKWSTVDNISDFQVKHMAVDRGNITDMVTGTSTQVSQGPHGGLVMRGAREGMAAAYVDGEKVYGSFAVPGEAIQQITVLSGGVPAEYGDLTGGLVVITTRSFWNGMAAKNDMYLDAAQAKIDAQKAADAKSGKIKVSNDSISEQQQDSTRMNVPGGQTPHVTPLQQQPSNDQPKLNAPMKNAAKND